jgi:hypothetical protein
MGLCPLISKLSGTASRTDDIAALNWTSFIDARNDWSFSAGAPIRSATFRISEMIRLF